MMMKCTFTLNMHVVQKWNYRRTIIRWEMERRGIILRNLNIRGDDFQLCFHIFHDTVLVNAISITDAEVNKK